MKAVFILVLLGVSAFASINPSILRGNKLSLLAKNRVEFENFKSTYGKSYASADEEALRFKNFQDNMVRAEELSKKNPKATFGVTKFSDLSQEEFAAKYLMNVDFKNDYVAPAAKDFSKATAVKGAVSCTPDKTNYNWESCGVCTPIYNQGQCGSCWAFSATETIESYWALSGQTLTQLSMEQIVDCDTAGEDQGCNGGFPSGAYTYVQNAGGIEAYSDYPYSAESGESGSCTFNSGDVACTVTGSQTISGETGLYQQTSTSAANGGGPVSVCVDASSWSAYTGGVLSQCGTDVDHCVQLVGYANYGQSGAYWVVRNSWGEDWGENGFIYLTIGEDLCSIGDYATIVSVAAA